MLGAEVVVHYPASLYMKENQNEEDIATIPPKISFRLASRTCYWRPDHNAFRHKSAIGIGCGRIYASQFLGKARTSAIRLAGYIHVPQRRRHQIGLVKRSSQEV
jgi:hypothetical protein